MAPAPLLLQLHQHHDAITAHMAVAAGMLRLGKPDPVAMGNMRWKLARLLNCYQLFKRHQVLEPVLRQDRADAIAARLKADSDAMDETFRDYLTKWSVQGIVGRDAEYEAEAKAIIAKLRAHIAREKAGIESLLGARGSA